MGFITDLIRESRSSELIKYLKDPSSILPGYQGHITHAGIQVSTEKALGLTAVWACIRLLAWCEASLPLVMYERLEKGKRRATDNPIYKIISKKPNAEQTSFKWREFMSVHQNLYGAGISEIEYDKNGYPVALWPIPTYCVKKIRTKNKELMYEVNVDGTAYKLWPYQVICFESLQVNSDRWISPIGMHRETLGSAIAVREFGAKTFGQGTNPGAIVSYPGQFQFRTGDSLESTRKAMREAYEGLSNAHRLMLLDQGAKYERAGLPPEDAQFLETRKWDTTEISRIYNVPLHLIQVHEGGTTWGSGIEELNSGFVVFTLMPYLILKEQELELKLIDDDKYFIKHNVDGLLRGKLEARYRSYSIGRQWGWLSPNDVCEMEDRNPLPGDEGDIYLNPMNMAPAEYFKQISDPSNDDKSKKA